MTGRHCQEMEFLVLFAPALLHLRRNVCVTASAGRSKRQDFILKRGQVSNDQMAKTSLYRGEGFVPCPWMRSQYARAEKRAR